MKFIKYFLLVPIFAISFLVTHYVNAGSATISSTPTCVLSNSYMNSTTIGTFCNVNLTWSTTGVTSPLVISNPGGGQISTSANGNVTSTVSHTPATFSVYDGSILSPVLAQTTSVGVCATNTPWNGTYCAPVINSTPTCVIQANQSTCNVGVTWENSGTPTNVAIGKDGRNYISSVATMTTPLSVPISHGSHTFSVYLLTWATNALATATSVASCVSGTTWNGSMCVSTTPSAIIYSDSSCALPANLPPFCYVDVTWSSNNVSNPIIKKSGNTFSTSANQTTPTQQLITYGSNNFEFYNSSTLLDSSVSTGVCPVNTTWNGTICATPPSAWISNTNFCTIPANASNCSVGMYWGSTNVTSPSMRQNGVQFATNANQTSSAPISRTITYGNGATNTFTFYDGTTLLDTSTAIGSCVSGTTWNGTICATNSSVTGTITSTPSCLISINMSTCIINVTWSTTGATSPNMKKNGLLVAVQASNSLGQTISNGTTAFGVYDGSTLLASSSSSGSCSSGLVWNGSVCTTSTPTGMVTATSACSVPMFASTCNISVGWVTSVNTTTPFINQNGSLLSTTTAGQNVTLANHAISRGVGTPPGTHLFELYDGSTLLDSAISVATCVANSTWNGSVCAPNASATINLSASVANPCLIQSGASSCNVGVTWSSSGTTSPSVTQDLAQFSTLSNQVIAVQRPISLTYGGVSTFRFYDGSTILATATAAASCTPGTFWTGSICAQAYITSTPSCTISANSSSCNVNVTWGNAGYTVASPSIKQDGTQFSVLQNQAPSPIQRSISNGNHVFTYYNGSTLLASSNSSASCISGTTWNGTICASSSLATATISADPSCLIPFSSSFCNVGVTWSSNGVTTPIVKQDGVQISTSANQTSSIMRVLSGNGPSGTPPGNHTFDFYDGTALLASTTSSASCDTDPSGGTGAYTYWYGAGAGACVKFGLGGGASVINFFGPQSPYASLGANSNPDTCYIPVNGNSCNINVTWAVGTGSSQGLASYPSIKQDGNTFSNQSFMLWPGVTRTLSYGSHIFALYSANGSPQYGGLEVSKTANAECAWGTTWDGSVCATNATGTGIITSSSNCIIPIGGSSCNVNVAWSSAGVLNPLVYQDQSQFSSAANQASPVQRTISYGAHAFQLTDTNLSPWTIDLIDESWSTATCASGSSWNGSACAQSNITANPSSCTIPINGSSCNISTTWSSSGNTNPTVKLHEGGSAASSSVISTSVTNQSTPVSVSLSKGNHHLAIYDGSTVLDIISVSASCTSGTIWDGAICSAGFITVSPSTCFIDEFALSSPTSSTCEVYVTWSSSGLTSPSIKQDGIQFSTSPSQSSGIKIIDYGNHTFTLNDGNNVISTASASAVCYGGTTWNGEECSSSVSEGARVSLDTTSNTTTIKKPVILTWSAPDSAYCEGNGFDTGSLTSGSVAVNPKSTTTYSVDCFDADGTKLSDTEKVAIGKLKITTSEGAKPASPVLPTCPLGSTWDPTVKKCSSSSIASLSVFQTTEDAYPDPYKCMIPAEGSTCDVLVAWTSRDVSKISVKQSGDQFSSLSENLSGVRRSIGFGTTYFTIYQGSLLLDTLPVEATCVSGTWDGNICNPNLNPTPQALYNCAQHNSGGKECALSCSGHTVTNMTNGQMSCVGKWQCRCITNATGRISFVSIPE